MRGAARAGQRHSARVDAEGEGPPWVEGDRCAGGGVVDPPRPVQCHFLSCCRSSLAPSGHRERGLLVGQNDGKGRPLRSGSGRVPRGSIVRHAGSARYTRSTRAGVGRGRPPSSARSTSPLASGSRIPTVDPFAIAPSILE